MTGVRGTRLTLSKFVCGHRLVKHRKSRFRVFKSLSSTVGQRKRSTLRRCTASDCDLLTKCYADRACDSRVIYSAVRKETICEWHLSTLGRNRIKRGDVAGGISPAPAAAASAAETLAHVAVRIYGHAHRRRLRLHLRHLLHIAVCIVNTDFETKGRVRTCNLFG